MSSEAPNDDNKSRILPFRRPGALFVHNPAPPPPPVADLGEYERRPNEPDDYRHRMLMNVLALSFTVALVAFGIWIADVMAGMRKNQDCVLTGRPGCTPVAVTPRER